MMTVTGAAALRTGMRSAQHSVRQGIACSRHTTRRKKVERCITWRWSQAGPPSSTWRRKHRASRESRTLSTGRGATRPTTGILEGQGDDRRGKILRRSRCSVSEARMTPLRQPLRGTGHSSIVSLRDATSYHSPVRSSVMELRLQVSQKEEARQSTPPAETRVVVCEPDPVEAVGGFRRGLRGVIDSGPPRSGLLPLTGAGTSRCCAGQAPRADGQGNILASAVTTTTRGST